MSVRTSDQIRQDFFDFFREKEHLIVESAPVVPEDDPTLLFINAGMNPFKPIFLDEQKGYKQSGKTWHRVANTQKCIRVSGKHNDLEEVGHDTYHHTLFEMLGNWSFGDYFKKEAVAWAWELLVDRWGLAPDRLYATVFEGDSDDGLPADDEAAKLWGSETPIPKDHILKYGKKDNFWEMGETGPCGPCSEVHIDLRPDEERQKVDGATLVNQDDPRVMEIWNLVFIQFNRQDDGSLEPLPAQHVDTGMGFERIVAVLQEKKSNYDTDVFTPLLKAISERAGIPYGKAEKTDIAMRVIADHIRAVSFAIADGAAPSNEDRGYVIRRILRRASRYAWDRLQIKEAFMSDLVDVLVHQFSKVFPEIVAKKKQVKKVIQAEEMSFLRTLDQGIAYFEKMIQGSDRLSGEDAFKLHDTYGFPVDLTDLMARERGITVDLDRFQELMKEQKDRARRAGKFKAGGDAGSEPDADLFHVPAGEGSLFTGYDELETSCRIGDMQYLNDKPAVVLDRTPFYAESGGQVSDTGVLVHSETGEQIRVTDILQVGEHRAHILDKEPAEKQGMWKAAVDTGRRAEIERNHTATHLMHAAMREILGEHVVQKGSLVAPDRLRFDFSHYEPVSQELVDRIEERVNQKIRENIVLEEDRDVPIEEAKRRGATMFFGEKYGERVRIVTFDPDFSKELCGGTHVRRTGDIGLFKITSETGVAAGVRRIEAVVGEAAMARVDELEGRLGRVAQLLKANPEQSEEKIRQILERQRRLEKELAQLQQRLTSGQSQDLTAQAVTVGTIQVLATRIDGANAKALRQTMDQLKDQLKSAAIVLASVDNDKVRLVAGVTRDQTERLSAGDLVNAVAVQVGGRGGGRADLAQAGGNQAEHLDAALRSVPQWVAAQLAAMTA